MDGKILERQAMAKVSAEIQARGKSLVFTNGCFDILHAGHVSYLIKAKSLGDYLVLGLNSDSSVSGIKGPERPLVPENQRALVLAALECIDYIVFFDEPTPLELIEAVKPHVLVKGADYEEKDIVGADFVKQNNGTVERIEFTHNISTTDIINKILAAYKK